MRRPEFIARQSRRPSGLLGWLIGRIMEGETAPENDIAVERLALQAEDAVLEVGFGPGRTLQRMAELVIRGRVAGVDLSDDMVAAATRRCQRYIARGRMELRHGSVERLPFPDGFFDKALSVHTLYFWEQPEQACAELRRVLKRDGVLVLCFREKGDHHADDFPPAVYRFHAAADVGELLWGCGFGDVAIERPVAAARGLAIVTARTA
ncbi:class I SAM-dependent methyltransferase [bacterium]|nr:class I SAM-dependent methyltransferase [bacterium]